jgi:hypothetical protein
MSDRLKGVILDRGKYARQCLHFPKAGDHRPTEMRLTFATLRHSRLALTAGGRPVHSQTKSVAVVG